MLPGSLSELIKEKLIEKLVNVEDSKEDDDMQSMLEKCSVAQRYLSICMNEMRDCINSANKIYVYCLSWLAAIAAKHKTKIEFVEEELCSLGKSFDLLNDKDGEKRRKVNSLQS